MHFEVFVHRGFMHRMDKMMDKYPIFQRDAAQNSTLFARDDEGGYNSYCLRKHKNHAQNCEKAWKSYPPEATLSVHRELHPMYAV